MRNLADVIDQILEVSTNTNLNARLEKIKSAIPFTAPELMYMRWDLVSEALGVHISNPIENNETVKIVSIWTTLTDDEVLAQFGDQ